MGRAFQRLVPSGAIVKYVRCFGSQTRRNAGECTIGMIGGKPDPVYMYTVTVGGHRFLARSSDNQDDHWRPPESFGGSY